MPVAAPHYTGLLHTARLLPTHADLLRLYGCALDVYIAVVPVYYLTPPFPILL